MKFLTSILSTMALAVGLTGCEHNVTGPVVTDPYAPMYGTYTGEIQRQDPHAGYVRGTDSVRVVITRTSAQPLVRIWQRGLNRGPLAVWYEVHFTPITIGERSGDPSEWYGIITGDGIPDVEQDGYDNAASQWDMQFFPYGSRQPVKIIADVHWPDAYPYPQEGIGGLKKQTP